MRKNILITGASSGLGLEMARQFAAKGRNLALCARRGDRLQVLQSQLKTQFPNIEVITRPLNVLDYDRVFDVFEAFNQELGGIDRVIVNAGIGKGTPLGTGNFRVNRQTAETNFVAALAQFEAALQIFRAQNRGHLVAVSSVAALRGLPRHATTYAATKAALASLAEGVRADVLHTPIKVTTLFPGFIVTDINPDMAKRPFVVNLEAGCRTLVKAIEREEAEAVVPPWPWKLISPILRHAPLTILSRI